MTRRWPALVLIPALILGALLFDQRSDTERARRDNPESDSTSVDVTDLALYMPVGSPADALSSTWFCAGGTAAEDGIADHAVVVSNPTDREATGSITAVPSEGDPVTKPLLLAPYSWVRITLTDLVSAPFAAAQVEFAGGQVAVEHEVSGPLGIDAAPCASSASSTWYFASGATTPNADETLVLFNPFPDAASVDITFATPQGRRTPQIYQGFLVPANSVVATSITDVVPINAQISTSVVTRTGRVVVDRLQSFDGETATTTEEAAAEEPYRPKGLTISLGVPQPTTSWMFPVGTKDEGAHERFVVYNPTSSDSEVDLAISLADPDINGEIDPFSLTVPSGSYQVVEIDDEARVPTKVDHSAVVVATNGVPVVVERLLTFERPHVAEGTAVSSGSPLVAPSWLFVSGGNVPDRLSERIAVQNPGANDVTVEIEVIADGEIGPVEGVGPITLGAYGHQVIRFADKLDNRQVSVRVTASGPIAAERLLFRIGEPGLSTAVGIPAPVGLARAPLSAAGG